MAALTPPVRGRSPAPVWLLILALLLAVALLLYALKPILTPFVVGALLAYLGDPLVDRLEARRCPRTLGVLVVFSVLALVITLALIVSVPLLVQQVDYLVQRAPAAYQWLMTELLPKLQDRWDVQGVLPGIDFKAQLAENWQSLGKFAADLGRQLTTSSLRLVLWVSNLVLIPVVAFYLMRDWDVLMHKILQLLPRAWQPRVAAMGREADEVVGAFLRGQFVVMLCLAVVYSVGLSLIGLELALLLGVVAGLASIVPYLGFIVGILAAGVAAYLQFQGFAPLLGVAAVFAVGQLLESMLLTPILVGDRIGLHPVAVIFVLLAGGQLAGFVGVLLALPVGAVIMVLLRHIDEFYRDSPVYRGDPP
jgi:predicted PurR-regulated permease PerM